MYNLDSILSKTTRVTKSHHTKRFCVSFEDGCYRTRALARAHCALMSGGSARDQETTSEFDAL
eukprot:393322-Prymnesium_polylepis.2